MTDRELFSLAKKAEEASYSPYSGFRVGAALECTDGTVYTGCNIENSSFGATICAERTAMVKAISEGRRSFRRIMITSSGGEAWPCGICRQFMGDLTDDSFEVMTGADADHIKKKTLAELLPEKFRL